MKRFFIIFLNLLFLSGTAAQTYCHSMLLLSSSKQSCCCGGSEKDYSGTASSNTCTKGCGDCVKNDEPENSAIQTRLISIPLWTHSLLFRPILISNNLEASYKDLYAHHFIISPQFLGQFSTPLRI